MLVLGKIGKSIEYTSQNTKIRPLYDTLSREEFKNPKRREKWFDVWKEWAKLDKRIYLDEWKHALWELDKMTRIEHVNVDGEFLTRKDNVTTVCDIFQRRSQGKVSGTFIIFEI